MQGYNFLSEEIHRFAEERLAQASGVIEPNRLRQQTCSAASRCAFKPVRPLGWICHGLASGWRPVRSGRRLRVTGSGSSMPAEGAAPDDNTAFDAVIEVERGGIHGFMGVETKLTEPFSQTYYAFENRYRRWRDQPEWWWRSGSEKAFATSSSTSSGATTCWPLHPASARAGLTRRGSAPCLSRRRHSLPRGPSTPTGHTLSSGAVHACEPGRGEWWNVGRAWHRAGRSVTG